MPTEIKQPGVSTRTHKSTAPKKPANMPSISLDSDSADMDAVQQMNSGRASGQKEVINLTTPTASSNTGKSKSKGSGKKKAPSDKGSRTVASIADMATGGMEEENSGVDVHESLEDDIFKEGGPFDQYKEEKTKEMLATLAQDDAKAEIQKEKEEAEAQGEAVDDEESEILEDQIEAGNNTGKTYTVNAVRRTPEEEAAAKAMPPQIDVPDIDYDALPRDPEESEPEKIDDYEPPVKPITESEINAMAAAQETEETETPVEDTEDYVGSEVEDDYEFDEEELKDLEGDEENDEVHEEKKTQAPPPPAEVEDSSEEDGVFEEDEDKKKKINRVKVAFTFDNNDIDELSDDDEISSDDGLPTEDERMEELKAEITRKIKPKAQSLNLEGYTVASKATASNIIFNTKDASAGKWVLPTTGICVEMREISGQQIEYLRENMGNNATQQRNALKVIYDHIISPKPQTFDAWAKTIAYADYDHLFMPIYLAAFSDSNYMPQTCTKEEGKIPKVETGCGKMFMSDNLPIMDCVKFKDEESKQKFWDLYDSDRTNPDGLYVLERTPISDKFVIDFKEPTLYSVLFEMGTFDRAFSEKYDTAITFMPYIDKIYWMDHANKKLVEVAYKKYENNESKTNKSKVIRYNNVFNSLNTDEYTNVVSIITAINEKNDWMTYQIPEMTCPECGRVIPAEEMSASGLVFTRHRLGILSNTSIK